MLRKDFGGYLEFVKKVLEADDEEMKKLCEERTQMYADKIQDVVAVAPSGDLLFIIVALKMLTEAAQKIDPKVTHMAKDCLTV